MSAWIKMRTDLRGDPRVRAITLACFGEDAASWPRNVSTVTGALHALWSLADQYTTDGELKTYTAGGLDSFVGIKGFARAMASPDVDWLEIQDKCLIIKRFCEHNGATAKERANTSKRVQRHRQSVTHRPLPEKIREEKNTPQPPQAGENGSAAKRGRSPKGDLGDLPGFLAFWSEFPDCERKVDRAGCARVWRRDELEPIAEQVNAGLRRWKVSESWAKDRGQFIPLPKTFLGQKRWETPPARNGHASELGPAEPLVVHRNL